MRSTLAVLILIAFVPVALSQEPNSSATCAISGIVTDAGTGQPLARATITLSEQGSNGGPTGGLTTDGSGRFAITNLSPGRYFMSASHIGYVTTGYEQQSTDGASRTVELAPGEQVKDISLRLLREAVITGHVYDEDGDPLEHAQATAMRFRYLDGKRQLQPVASAQTDDRGKFRLYDLPPGQYYVSAYASLAPGPAGGTSYAPAYYPGVSDPSAASPITLGPGDEFPGADIYLQPVGTYHIRGRVMGAAGGGPPQNIMLQLVPDQQTASGVFFSSGTTVRDGQGDFDVSNVRPGSYFLIARISNQGTLVQAHQAVQVLDSDVNGVTVTVAPGATLEGHVRAEGAVNVSNMHVWLQPQSFYFYGATQSTVRPDGSFVLPNIADGTYHVLLFGMPPGAYLKSVTLDGQDVIESGFNVASGEAPGSTLDLLVSANGGRIAGTVMLDDKPLGRAQVTLAPADDSMLGDDLWFKDATTGLNGGFMLQGIRPGSYRVLAWQHIEPGEDRNPNFIEQFLNRGREISVTPDSTQTLQLDALPARETESADH